VKTMAREIGLDPAGFSAHSLQVQVAQDLTQQGINNEAIMCVTGHVHKLVRDMKTRDSQSVKS
jgi:hypothetical protein